MIRHRRGGGDLPLAASFAGEVFAPSQTRTISRWLRHSHVGSLWSVADEELATPVGCIVRRCGVCDQSRLLSHAGSAGYRVPLGWCGPLRWTRFCQGEVRRSVGKAPEFNWGVGSFGMVGCAAHFVGVSARTPVFLIQWRPAPGFLSFFFLCV